MSDVNGNLEIYQKFMELIFYTDDITKKFPKKERFALVAQMKKAVYEGLTLLIHAIKVYNKKEKAQYLAALDIKMSILKVHVRIANKYRYISVQNYEAWSRIITSVCNMTGGWIAACVK